MTAPAPRILAINAGSSSIKFAIYPARVAGPPLLGGKLDQFGPARAKLSWQTIAGESGHGDLPSAGDGHMAQFLGWLDDRRELSKVSGVGHRIVHGMTRTLPALVTSELIDELRATSAYAPEHLPFEIELIEALRARHPELPQDVSESSRGFPSTALRVRFVTLRLRSGSAS